MGSTVHIKKPFESGDGIGTVKGSPLTAQEVHENFLFFAREWANAMSRAGLTQSDSDNTQFYQIVKKVAVETKWKEGTIIPMMDHETPSVWDPANPDNYNPVLNLSAITTTQIIDSTGVSSGLTLSPITKLVAPKAVTYLRNFLVALRRGQGATEKSSFSVASWTTTSSTVGTITLANSSDEVAVANALIEDACVAGASADMKTYTPSFRIPITLPSAIGNIPAGDYTVTNIAGRTFTISGSGFSVGSGSGSWSCQFSPFRIVGSTTTARVFPGQGRTLVGANDSLGEVIAGLQRRDRFMLHAHQEYMISAMTGGGVIGYGYQALTGDGVLVNAGIKTGSPISDGTATPRLGVTTDPRGMGSHLIFGLGGLVA